MENVSIFFFRSWGFASDFYFTFVPSSVRWCDFDLEHFSILRLYVFYQGECCLVVVHSSSNKEDYFGVECLCSYLGPCS
jgi:hypothetical protein